MSFQASTSLTYPQAGASDDVYAAFYRDLRQELSGLLHDERDWLANLANAAALLALRLPELNWCGFYLQREGQLIVGPFIGKPACVRIRLGRGVCGTTAVKRSSTLVPDVNEFPGHIACDADSASELVVPLLLGSRLLGVLDLDSPRKARFCEADRLGLEALATLVAQACDWPAEVGG